MKKLLFIFILTFLPEMVSSQDELSNDYEVGTTVYFAYQYPVRTIVLGDDLYDTSLDHAHKYEIMATFGGSYNGSNGIVNIAVDESLCNNLYFEDGITPVKAMPGNYYQLSTTSLEFNGTFYGKTEVQLTDDFFNDPEAVNKTYVIPLVMTSQTGFENILTGVYNEGCSGPRTDETIWEIKPKDYVLYCVKFQNKFSGLWLTNGNTDTSDIEHALSVRIMSIGLNTCSYSVSYDKDGQIFTADLLLAFDGNNCIISSLTDGVIANGVGSWGDNTEIKAWGNKDRDGLELNYNVDFGEGNKFSTHEKLVWQSSGVRAEQFLPVYDNSVPVIVNPDNENKCETPTIKIENGKIVFDCKTEGVLYNYSISNSYSKNGAITTNVLDLNLTNKYIISVYASKPGYINSETTMIEIEPNGNVFGDLNQDGKVNAADHVVLSSIIMKQ